MKTIFSFALLAVPVLLTAQVGSVVIERDHKHLGSGAGLSPDGSALVYIAGDDSLVLRDLTSGEETVLVKEVDGGLNVFASPVFSSDGNTVFFVASGGTSGYPSGVFAVDKATPLTVRTLLRSQPSAEGSPLPFDRYYHAVSPGPEGSAGLAVQYREGDTDRVALLQEGVTTPVGTGKLLAWQARDSVIVDSDGAVLSLDTAGNQTPMASPEDGPVVGFFGDEVITLRAGAVRGQSGGAYSVAAVRTVPAGRGAEPESFPFGASGFPAIGSVR